VTHSKVRVGGRTVVVPLFLAVASITLGLGGSVGVASAASNSGGDVVLGTDQPLSGPFASLGQQTDAGVQYAVNQVNAAGGIGGRKVKLVAVDSSTDSESTAITATNKLLESKPEAIVGPTDSTTLLPASTVSERAHVPMCTQSFDDDITQRGYKYIFQVLSTASTIAQFTVPAIKQLAPLLHVNTQKIALLYDNTAGTVSLFSGLPKLLTADGMKVVYNQQYDVGLTSATDLATAIKASGAQLLVQGSSSPPDVSLITAALKAEGVNIPVMNPSGGSANPTYIQSVGKGVNGSFIVAEWLPSMKLGSAQNTLLSKFNQTIKSQDKLPFAGNFTGMGYVCASELLSAMKTAGANNPGKVRNVMSSTNFTSGPASLMPPGNVRYNSVGVNKAASVMVGQWCHGLINVVLPKSVANASAQSPKACQ
jgi:branched-chain amino acid transport system substrate-binding protein